MSRFCFTGMVQLSPDDGSRVLAAGIDGVQLDSTRSVCTAGQLWKFVGNEIVNEKTGEPLEVDGASTWTWEEDNDGKILIQAIRGGNPRKNYLRRKRAGVVLGNKYSWTKK